MLRPWWWRWVSRVALGVVAVGMAMLSPLALSAQDAVSSQDAVESGVVRPAPIPLAPIPLAAGPIAIDGHLDEAAWSAALVIDLAWETRPGDNLPAPVATQCFLIYDRDRLYVGFRAQDPEPQRIRARMTDRDEAFSDDFVGVILDTFNDERRAFQFFVNPLGVQMDVFLDQVNGGEDASWDTLWTSAGRLTADGYEVEMAIPFSSLRFPRRQGPQVWGLDALRFWPRDSRYRLTNVRRDRGNSCHLCQLSKIVGFEGISPGRNLELVPTLTATRTDEAPEEEAQGLVPGDEDVDGGLTLRWGVTPNLILSGTVNPDFSQIEADVAQLDINERFALFFPERRPFFLEGADFFDTPLRTVFTRNVANPDWGLKFSGKQGKSAFGAFVAQDSATQFLIPGTQSSDAADLDLESTDLAFRYRRDVGSASALGVIATSREAEGYENRVFGVDGLWRLSDATLFRFQALGSRSLYPQAVAEEFEQPQGSFGGHALRLQYDYQARDWQAYATYEDLGEDFRADLGFVSQVNYRKSVLGLQRVWWGEAGDWFNRLSFGGDWDLTTEQDGRELEQELEFFLNYDGPRESEIFLGGGVRRRFFDGLSFDEVFGSSFFQIQATGDLRLSLFLRAGDDIDFANSRAGTQRRINPSVRYQAGRHLRLTLDHDVRHLDVDGGRLFEANLSQLQAQYQFNLRMQLRFVGQYTDVQRDPSLYREVVEAQERRFLTQLVASYKLNSQTVLFLGYSDISKAEGDADLNRTGRTFFFKVGYAWVL